MAIAFIIWPFITPAIFGITVGDDGGAGVFADGELPTDIAGTGVSNY